MPETTMTQQKSNRNVIASGLLFALIALIGVLIVLYAWRLPPFHSSLETTENALVRGQVTIISPQLSGYVVEVDVQDYQIVHQGQLLMRIDDRIYQQRLDQAQAQLATQTVTGTAGGGLIEATVSGTGELLGLVIKPEAIDPDDPETLADLIVAAVRDGNHQAMALAQSTMPQMPELG